MEDNIADVDDLELPMTVQPMATIQSPHDDPNGDLPNDSDYLEIFAVLSVESEHTKEMIAQINEQPDDQQRLYAAIRCIDLLQNNQEKMYDLMVEMNNFFGKYFEK